MEHIFYVLFEILWQEDSFQLSVILLHLHSIHITLSREIRSIQNFQFNILVAFSFSFLFERWQCWHRAFASGSAMRTCTSK